MLLRKPPQGRVLTDSDGDAGTTRTNQSLKVEVTLNRNLEAEDTANRNPQVQGVPVVAEPMYKIPIPTIRFRVTQVPTTRVLGDRVPGDRAIEAQNLLPQGLATRLPDNLHPGGDARLRAVGNPDHHLHLLQDLDGYGDMNRLQQRHHQRHQLLENHHNLQLPLHLPQNHQHLHNRA